MKNYLKRAFLCITLTASMLAVKAQEPQFSQFFSAPTFMSPSLAGSTGGMRVVANYRNQWPGIPNSYNTFSAAGDIYVNTLKSGFGAIIWRDIAGTTSLSTTHFGLQYTYRLQISDTWTWIPGLEFGFEQKSVDGTKAVTGNDINSGGGTGISYFESGQASYLDFKFSSFFYNRKFWGGFNLFHLTTPSYSFVGQKNEVPLYFSVFGGMNIWRQPTQRQTLPRSFCVSYRYTYQNDFNQLDLGGYWFNRNFEVGAWWRGVPIFNNRIDKVVDQSAVILSAAMIFGIFKIGYSYDIPISELNATSAGAHEISLIMEFGDIFGCGARYLDCFTKRAGLRFNKKRPRDLKLR
ncbi:PorP/SprF family type IX secretion system membrane protein [Halosquirtibacter xylanolyticus]|uniref:PorP/SprF family type IX secretion system membrane protein n=1 Tax=Halosquirtibacter xylanolyticus TaxID=3374599 RepID=UPI00374994FC|nr:PorP/SprF family type IX secretion system membrane protein [Prolixibacteraceae bacterium]